jgi:hypothetical protein
VPRAIRVDLTSVLLWGGVALLLWSLRSPYAAGHVIAAGEQQALSIVRALVAADAALPAAAAPSDPGARARLAAELQAGWDDAGQPPIAWPAFVPEVGDRLLLQNADWMFLLAATPPLPGDEDAPAGAELLEAWAWPRHEGSRLDTVFCARPGQTISSRNLANPYLGTRRMPEPGGWRPRSRERQPEFWGADGHFWRPHP